MVSLNRAQLAFIVLIVFALGSAVTFGVDRLDAPKPIIISGTINESPIQQLASIPSGTSAGQLSSDTSQTAGGTLTGTTKHHRRSGGRSTHKKITSGVIHINSATLDQLEELPGVGPSTAQAIIDFRTQAGGFTSVDDLGDIPRMGKKKLAKMMPFVAL